MKTFMWFIVVIDQVALVLIGGMHFNRYRVSDYRFSQQLSTLDKSQAKLQRHIFKKLPEILVLQQLASIICRTILATLFSLLFGFTLGLAYSLISFLIISQVVRLNYVQKKSEQLFMYSTNLVFKKIKLLSPLFSLLGFAKGVMASQISSYDEFKDTLRRLPNAALSVDRRQKLETVLDSEELSVGQCMTAKKDVATVQSSATLGPITLSDLQKTSHGYFPVVSKENDIEGILRLGDISDISSAKKASKVSELLSHHISWIDESASLHEAAELFLDEKQYIIMVNDDSNEWSGILTMADLLKHTIGFSRK